MIERRRSARFALTWPLDAHVSVLHDAQIEDSGPDELVLRSEAPGVRGEELTLRVGSPEAVQMTLVGRTVGSEPRLAAGRVMHRVRLALSGAIALSNGTDAASNSWRPGDRTTAVLERRHMARVVNLGRGGCLLEFAAGLPAGTVATLHTDRLTHPETIRVGFVFERRGKAWPYAGGVEFLSLGVPTSRSLRSLARRMEDACEGPRLGSGGEESEVSMTSSVRDPFDLLSLVCRATGSDEQPRADVRRGDAQTRPGSHLAVVKGRAGDTINGNDRG